MSDAERYVCTDCRHEFPAPTTRDLPVDDDGDKYAVCPKCSGRARVKFVLCTYSGFPDEPNGGPCCCEPAQHRVRCPECHAVVARCEQHGGYTSAQKALMQHSLVLHPVTYPPRPPMASSL